MATPHTNLQGAARVVDGTLKLRLDVAVVADEPSLGLFEETTASTEPANRTKDHSSVLVSSGTVTAKVYSSVF